MSKSGANEAAHYVESIFGVTNQGIVFVDQDGIILRVNPAFIKIFGYEEHEILGKPFSILEYKDEVMQKNVSKLPLINFYRTENTNLEVMLYDKENQGVSVRFRSVLIRDKNDQVRQAIGMIEHMAELMGTNEGEGSLAKKMWEAQQNFENVLNHSDDAVLICDISGNIMTPNKAFIEMIDYTQEEVRGKHIVEFCAFVEGTYRTTTDEEVVIDEAYVQNAAQMSTVLFEKGCVKNWEMYFVRKDTVHLPVETTMSILQDKDGEKRGTLVISRDITKRKRAVKALREAYNELEKKVEERTASLKSANEQLKQEITERTQAEEELKETKDHLDNVIESSLDGIVIGDSTGNIIRANETFLKMIGYQKEELKGKHVMELSILEKGIYESVTGDKVEIDEEYFDDARKMTFYLQIEKGQ